MYKKVMGVVVAFVLAAGIAVPAQAQQGGGIAFGPQVSYGDDSDFGIGARVEVPLSQVVPGLFAIGSFDYFFPDDGSGSVEGFSYDLSYFEVNANVAYPFVIEDSPLLPYVGGGLNLARISLDLDMPGASASESETELGLNLLGGSKFDIGAAVVPFLEFRVELSGGEQFVISGGILF